MRGGSRFIGSHLSDRLSAGGHDVLVLDDLSTGRSGYIEHLLGLTGWASRRTVGDAIDDVILYERAALDAEPVGRIGLAR